MMQDAVDSCPQQLRRSRSRRLLIWAVPSLCVVVCASALIVYRASRQGTSDSPPSLPRINSGSPTPSPAAPPNAASGAFSLSTPDPRSALAASPQLVSLPGGSGLGGGAVGGLGTGRQSLIATLMERVRARPTDVTARVGLLTQLDLAGRHSDAEDVIRQALQSGQRHPRLYHALGMLYMRHKRYDAAAEVFRCEVELKPNSADAHVRLAQCYSLVGERERARTHFERTMKLKPSEPDTYIGLAFLNSSNQRANFAIKYLTKYIRLVKNPGQAYLLLSRIYVNQDRHAEAIEAALKGVAVMPDNPEIWYNLGQAYAYSRGGKLLDKAEEAFKRVLQLAPDHGHGHFELASVYQKLGRIPEATERYADAVRCEPLSGRYHYQYGRALVLAQRKEEAERELARAKELLPLNQREEHLRDRLSAVQNDTSAWCELATIYRKYGNDGMAIAYVDRALRISPGLASAQSLRDELVAAGAPPARAQ
jgi:tetratricopeptide (TPR) repeat protein